MQDEADEAHDSVRVPWTKPVLSLLRDIHNAAAISHGGTHTLSIEAAVPQYAFWAQRVLARVAGGHPQVFSE